MMTQKLNQRQMKRQRPTKQMARRKMEKVMHKIRMTKKIKRKEKERTTKTKKRKRKKRKKIAASHYIINLNIKNMAAHSTSGLTSRCSSHGLMRSYLKSYAQRSSWATSSNVLPSSHLEFTV